MYRMDEQTAIAKLQYLFSLVQAQQPDKGIRAILKRAQTLAKTTSVPYHDALQHMVDAAEVRTYRRLALLNACSIASSKET
jgi:hypothetical protein